MAARDRRSRSWTSAGKFAITFVLVSTKTRLSSSGSRWTARIMSIIPFLRSPSAAAANNLMRDPIMASRCGSGRVAKILTISSKSNRLRVFRQQFGPEMLSSIPLHRCVHGAHDVQSRPKLILQSHGTKHDDEDPTQENQSNAER